MMSDQEHLREKQWQQLSSYLDGQVDERERKIIEGQLSSDPELQRAYALLKKNRTLLRNLPRRRAPRNFTLTAEMAGQKIKSQNRWLLFPALSFASVISLALIILSFVVKPFAANTASLAAAPAAEMAAQLDTAAKEANTPPPLIYWGGYQGPAFGSGGSLLAGKGGGGSDQPTTLMMTPEPAVPAIGGPSVGVETAPQESVQATEMAEAEPAAEPGTQFITEEPSGGAGPSGLILGLPPTENRGQQNEQVNREMVPTKSAEQQKNVQARWWLLRGVLLLVGLLSAGGAVILWKRRQLMD